MTTYVDNSFLDMNVTIFDDGSKLVVDNDQDRSIGWTTKSTHYTTNGKADYGLVKYNDEQSSLFEWDVNHTFDWNSHKDSFERSWANHDSYVT